MAQSWSGSSCSVLPCARPNCSTDHQDSCEPPTSPGRCIASNATRTDEKESGVGGTDAGNKENSIMFPANLRNYG
jgi:hypothetical protein